MVLFSAAQNVTNVQSGQLVIQEKSRLQTQQISQASIILMAFV